MSRSGIYILAVSWFMIAACSKGTQQKPTPPPPSSIEFSGLKVNGVYNGYTYKGINTVPVIKISFTGALSHTSIAGAVSFTTKAGASVNYSTAYQNNDSTIVITPAGLQPITQY